MVVKKILSWVWLVVAAVKGAFAIKVVVEGEGSIDDKIAGVSSELAKVVDKLKSIAAATPATWDDDFVGTLKEVLDSFAEGLLDDLVAEGLVK